MTFRSLFLHRKHVESLSNKLLFFYGQQMKIQFRNDSSNLNAKVRTYGKKEEERRKTCRAKKTLGGAAVEGGSWWCWCAVQRNKKTSPCRWGSPSKSSLVMPHSSSNCIPVAPNPWTRLLNTPGSLSISDHSPSLILTS